jgi:hypothetical protein
MAIVFGPLSVILNGCQWLNYGFVSLSEDEKIFSIEELNGEKKIVMIKTISCL